MQSVILVQNLPDCKRHELEELCKPFGEILGTMVMGNDGFVQFVCEDQAEDAIEALDMSTFKSNVLAVRNAYWGKVSMFLLPRRSALRRTCQRRFRQRVCTKNRKKTWKLDKDEGKLGTIKIHRTRTKMRDKTRTMTRTTRLSPFASRQSI